MTGFALNHLSPLCLQTPHHLTCRALHVRLRVPFDRIPWTLTKVPRFLGQFRNCPQPTPRMEGLLGLAPQFAYCFERA